MNRSKKRIIERARRAERVRKKIMGTSERPRMCVRRSLKHIYAQIIDDNSGKTIVQVGSRGKEFSQKITGKELTKTDISKKIGEMLAEWLKKKVLLRLFLTEKVIFTTAVLRL